jgi:predicted nucleotidyltransferase
LAHAAVFGSVARGEAGTGSNIDVLVERDDSLPMGIFELRQNENLHQRTA